MIYFLKVGFVIHNLPVIAKMAAVGKACGNMFQLAQVMICQNIEVCDKIYQLVKDKVTIYVYKLCKCPAAHL